MHTTPLKKGDVVTLSEDDGSKCPAFTGENGAMVTNGVTWSFARLSDLKPVRTSKLTKSKQFLADAIHASGKGWPDVADWAVQIKIGPSIYFATGALPPTKDGNGWRVAHGDLFLHGETIKVDKLFPNWHQTVLSREEYFSAYPAESTTEPASDADDGVAFEVLGDSTLVIGGDPLTAMRRMQDSLVFDAEPTIEQLAADYRNKLDYANRKQQEADEAKADAEAKLAELVEAGKASGLVLSIAGTEPELVITDWRELKERDLIWFGGDDEQGEGEYIVLEVEELNYGGTRAVRISTDGSDHWIDTTDDWRFIRRP